ncbi:MAG: hypothetical protein ACYC9S_02005 [Leptospirales bacterium]
MLKKDCHRLLGGFILAGLSIYCAFESAYAATRERAGRAHHHAPRHFGSLSVARLGAVSNYEYVEHLTSGIPGNYTITNTHAWVHEAQFTADGRESGVQSGDNWRVEMNTAPGIAFILTQGKLWAVTKAGAPPPQSSAVGTQRQIDTPRNIAQDFIDDLHNGYPQRQLSRLGGCSVAGRSGTLYAVWRPAQHAIYSEACIQTGGGPILSYHCTGTEPFGQQDWELTKVGGVPVQLPRY